MNRCSAHWKLGVHAWKPIAHVCVSFSSVMAFSFFLVPLNSKDTLWRPLPDCEVDEIDEDRTEMTRVESRPSWNMSTDARATPRQISPSQAAIV